MKYIFFIFTFTFVLHYPLNCATVELRRIDDFDAYYSQNILELNSKSKEQQVQRFRHFTSTGTEYCSSDYGRTWYKANIVRKSHSNIKNYRHISSKGIVKISDDAGKSWKTSSSTISETNTLKVIVANNNIKVIMKNADELISEASIFRYDGSLVSNDILYESSTINKEELNINVSEFSTGVYYLRVLFKDNTYSITKFIKN